MGKLDGKVAVITGGACGIGSGLEKVYVKEGAMVAIVDLNVETGEAMVKELQEFQPESTFIQAHLTDRAKLKDIIATVVNKYGKLNILVNNTHASRQVLLADATQADMDFSFNTGSYPTFYLMQAAYPHLKESLRG